MGEEDVSHRGSCACVSEPESGEKDIHVGDGPAPSEVGGWLHRENASGGRFLTLRDELKILK